MKEILPDAVVERLSIYRQALAKYQYAASPHINSADLARILGTSEENVRRDLMLIDCKATTRRKGFSVPVILEKITSVLDFQDNTSTKIAIVGNDACISEIIQSHYGFQNTTIEAIFDFDVTEIKQKDDRCYYPVSMLRNVIEEKKILLVVLNLSPDFVEQIAEIAINAGIKGIINFSPVRLNVPPHIYLDEINQITLIEKAVYYIKNNEIQS